jgi:CubicO group peptidase (beta-lactamase class C family)
MVAMVGTSSDIETLVDAEIAGGSFPGIVLLVAKAGRIVCSLVKGDRQVEPDREGMTEDTIFDLASVTKPLATALICLMVCGQERISLDEKIGTFIPEIATECRSITLRQLLIHTAGLPPVPDIYKAFKVPRNIEYNRAVQMLLAVKPEKPPGQVAVYSCTGYLLLGQFLRRATGARLQELFAQLIAAPCKLSDTMFNPPVILWGRVAATEYCNWRKRWIRGQVHDENSFCLGGEGGNAGLFSTARSVLTLLSLFENGGVVNGTQLITAQQERMMRTCFTEGMGLRRSIGFYMYDDDAPCGPLFSRDSFGHTGFTGTSIWLEPAKSLIVVTLTNRVHLGREQTEDKIKEFRKNLHTAVYRNWGT